MWWWRKRATIALDGLKYVRPDTWKSGVHPHPAAVKMVLDRLVRWVGEEELTPEGWALTFVEQLMTDTGYSRAQVQRCLRALEHRGYVVPIPKEALMAAGRARLPGRHGLQLGLKWRNYGLAYRLELGLAATSASTKPAQQDAAAGVDVRALEQELGALKAMMAPLLGETLWLRVMAGELAQEAVPTGVQCPARCACGGANALKTCASMPETASFTRMKSQVQTLQRPPEHETASAPESGVRISATLQAPLDPALETSPEHASTAGAAAGARADVGADVALDAEAAAARKAQRGGECPPRRADRGDGLPLSTRRPARSSPQPSDRAAGEVVLEAAELAALRAAHSAQNEKSYRVPLLRGPAVEYYLAPAAVARVVAERARLPFERAAALVFRAWYRTEGWDGQLRANQHRLDWFDKGSYPQQVLARALELASLEAPSAPQVAQTAPARGGVTAAEIEAFTARFAGKAAA